MSKYYVEYKELGRNAVSMQSIDKTFAAFEGRLIAIANSMDCRDSTMELLKAQVNSASKSISPTNKRVISARNALENLAVSYQETEQSVFANIDNVSILGAVIAESTQATVPPMSLDGFPDHVVSGFNARLDTVIRETSNTYRGQDITAIPVRERDGLITAYQIRNPEHAKIVNDFLDPLIEDGTYTADIKNLKYLIYASPDSVREITLLYLPDLFIGDYTATEWGEQYYIPGVRAIYVSLFHENGLNCRLGGYNTFFHELGHGIYDVMGTVGAVPPNLHTVIGDDVSGKLRADIATYFSDIPLPGYEIAPVIDKILTGLKTGTPLSEPALEEIRLNVHAQYTNAAGDGKLNGDINSGASDVYGGATGNNVRGEWGHSDEYWNDSGDGWLLCTEFFAHAYSNTLTQYEGRWDTFAENLPASSGLFVDSIDASIDMY